MSYPDPSPHAVYAAAVESLAGRVLGALTGTQGPAGPARHVEEAGDPKAALAAVRVLGPDVFAPALLAGAPFGPADREAVTEAFRVFPPGPDDPPETVWRDRATAALLTRHGGDPVAPGAQPVSRTPRHRWRIWAGWMARLSPLALPGVTGPLPDPDARAAQALAMGTTRALLRRDHPTAARLARWAAYADGRGVPCTLDLGAVLDHIELCGSGTARTALDTAIARRLAAGSERRTA
ncbi:hypothetical protein [Streptomyces johnsoniae]|uniref:Uncharacterized protein n=1 Tax=Streptomyces johnsoniae TaxID=3075532 RepID=A0ABU2RXJ2_9ACTN|nr:hypothetical protein [Streptomyces sp. DSM 41886]MDT0441471.1 hypothetical protein [Streptomyces sp. DSM 41886]